MEKSQSKNSIKNITHYNTPMLKQAKEPKKKFSSNSWKPSNNIITTQLVIKKMTR
jgi:hypothetical protein